MAIAKKYAKGALELLEEAVHLLRAAPASLWAAYYTGTLPFVLAFLYFWADMSRSPFAHQYLVQASLGLALLYIWMKCWQAVFSLGMKSLISGSVPEGFSFSRIARLALHQTILQAWSVILLPLVLLMVLPFGSMYAFFQSVSVTADGRESDLKTIIRRTWKLANLWPFQNHGVIFIVALFSLVVFLNWATVIILIPELIRMFLGVETIFTLSGIGILNTTFLAVAIALTYLSLNPLQHTVYMLRCFWGESLQSGADLQAELKAVASQELQTGDTLRSA